MFLAYLLLGIGAFLLGAVPFGFLAGKRKGIDLRKVGSGNIGATNTFRALGWKTGTVVFLLDAMKGFLPVFVATHLPAYLQHPTFDKHGWGAMAVGIVAMLGHIFSPFLGFKGGKGVAAALGVLIGLSPILALIAFVVFVTTVWLTKYVSLGSMLSATVQAILIWFWPGQLLAAQVFGTFAAVFIVIRHKDNIKRLMNGTENKFSFKKKEAGTETETEESDSEESTG